jgi:hypothetical protein
MGRVRAAPLLGWGRWAPFWLGAPRPSLGTSYASSFARPWGKLIC